MPRNQKAPESKSGPNLLPSDSSCSTMQEVAISKVMLFEFLSFYFGNIIFRNLEMLDIFNVKSR